VAVCRRQHSANGGSGRVLGADHVVEAVCIEAAHVIHSVHAKVIQRSY
jgi:hypothetical protein